MARVMIRLENDERDALLILARREKRDVRAQAALIVCEALVQRGLLHVNADATTERDATRQMGVVNRATT